MMLTNDNFKNPWLSIFNQILLKLAHSLIFLLLLLNQDSIWADFLFHTETSKPHAIYQDLFWKQM